MKRKKKKNTTTNKISSERETEIKRKIAISRRLKFTKFQFTKSSPRNLLFFSSSIRRIVVEEEDLEEREKEKLNFHFWLPQVFFFCALIPAFAFSYVQNSGFTLFAHSSSETLTFQLLSIWGFFVGLGSSHTARKFWIEC